MMLSHNQSVETLPSLLFGKKNDGVDKGTTRETPGNSEGARPPKKEDYQKVRQENDRENDPQAEIVDNEERDKNRK